MTANPQQQVLDHLKYDIVIDRNGTERWFLNGKLHREDGPAVIRADGTQYWYLNGVIHREDGPAVIWADGMPWWFHNGERIK
jgi:hypothetical protein